MEVGFEWRFYDTCHAVPNGVGTHRLNEAGTHQDSSVGRLGRPSTHELADSAIGADLSPAVSHCTERGCRNGTVKASNAESQEFQLSQTHDLKKLYLSLPRLAISINRVGQGLVRTGSDTESQC